MIMYKEKIRKRFDELASSYSDKSVGFILNKRVGCIKRYNKEDDVVLEIGCGSGNVLWMLKGKRYGVDISEKMVRAAKNRIEGGFVNSDAESLPFKDEVFDAIVISEVLYYLKSNEKIIEESFRCLKNDGMLLITSLNKPWRFLNTLANLFRIGVHDNVSLDYPKLEELKLSINKYFEIIDVRGIPFGFLKISPIFFIAARKERRFKNN